MTTIETHDEEQLSALEELRTQVAATRYALAAPSVDQARGEAEALVSQLDDYVLPRVRSLDAPLLAVVGGSTGAGKSTLVNSIVGRKVSSTGVLRPTTRSPVLIVNPEEEQWYADDRVLPSLPRTTEESADGASLRLVPVEEWPCGLALLDAPDIDSVVKQNRDLARQLLAAADLWMFVTSAARYADAVPWDLLTTARQRGTVVAVVLDRVPPVARDEIGSDIARMLSERGFGGAMQFVVPESRLDGGRLPEVVVAPIREWLRNLAADPEARLTVVHRTLGGALASLGPRVTALASAADEQAVVAAALRQEANEPYAAAVREIDARFMDASPLHGQVLACLQESLGTGELLSLLRTWLGRLRCWVRVAIKGPPKVLGTGLQSAIETAVKVLALVNADQAAERAAAAWRTRPAGAALLDGTRANLARSSQAFGERAGQAIRDWQQYTLELVRNEYTTGRSSWCLRPLGIDAAAGIVMTAAFLPPDRTGIDTGGDTGGVLGGDALSGRLLEVVYGDETVRRLATAARDELSGRIQTLLSTEVERFTSLLETDPVSQTAGSLLRVARDAVERAR